MKNKKRLSVLLVMVILIGVLVPTIVLAEDFTGGQIIISSNELPTIDRFECTQIAAGGTLDPATTYDISLTVSDADSIDDITSITLMFWHTTDILVPTQLPSGNGYNMNDKDSAVTYIMTIFDGTTSVMDTSFTGWTQTAPATPNAPDTLTSFDFDCSVRPGPEAREVETATNDNKWLIGVEVVDSSGTPVFMLINGDTNPHGMAWYGQMDTNTDSGPKWTAATPGMTYNSSAAQVFDESTFRMEVYSNGAYSMRVSTDTTWSNGSTDITYNTAIDSADQFSFAIDTAGSYDSGTAQELPNDTNSDGKTEFITLSTPTDNSWGTATGYTGELIANICMFLQTNASMTASATPYTGVITFELVNN